MEAHNSARHVHKNIGTESDIVTHSMTVCDIVTVNLPCI